MQFHEYKNWIFDLNFTELWGQNVIFGQVLCFNMILNDVTDDESALV